MLSLEIAMSLSFGTPLKLFPSKLLPIVGSVPVAVALGVVEALAG